MKILTVCDFWNNRSVHLAHPLKYWGNDVIAVGLKKNSPETLEMLFQWADYIICTAEDQIIPEQYKDKYRIMNVWPDTYERPFNVELRIIVKKYLDDNRSWLKN